MKIDKGNIFNNLEKKIQRQENKFTKNLETKIIFRPNEKKSGKIKILISRSTQFVKGDIIDMRKTLVVLCVSSKLITPSYVPHHLSLTLFV